LQIRKAKLIASYELHIKVNWQGTTADGQQGSGLIELPYVADENHDEDPEIKVLLPEESAAAQQLKAEILAKGKEVSNDHYAAQHCQQQQQRL
jgi:activator of HSP90 ATPase